MSPVHRNGQRRREKLYYTVKFSGRFFRPRYEAFVFSRLLHCTHNDKRVRYQVAGRGEVAQCNDGRVIKKHPGAGCFG